MLPHPFLGRKRYISDNFKDVRKMNQGIMSNDFTTSTIAIHRAKDQIPTNGKPNINGLDFWIYIKNLIKQIKERLQFMKTIEGTT